MIGGVQRYASLYTTMARFGLNPECSAIFRPEAFYVSGLKTEKHGAREAITENVFSVESGAGTSGKAETVERN